MRKRALLIFLLLAGGLASASFSSISSANPICYIEIGIGVLDLSDAVISKEACKTLVFAIIEDSLSVFSTRPALLVSGDFDPICYNFFDKFPCGAAWYRTYNAVGYVFEGFWQGIDNNFTISLTPPSGVPESGTVLSSIEPAESPSTGQNTTTLIARVHDQNGAIVSNVNVQLTVNVTMNSGGHAHNNNRNTTQMGKLSSSQGSVAQNGKVLTGNTGLDGLPFTFAAPAAAGDHTITAICTDRTCTQNGLDKVWVGVKGLKWQASSPNYVLLPNRDANHPGNHYVTRNTERNVSNFAAAYHEEFPNDPVLHFNDASIERGGLFDVGSNWSISPGHETHRRGANVDVKANEFYHEPSQSIPTSNYIDFWNMGADYDCYVALHSGATPNEHFHLYCP
jgi:hypothetical protein